jgi:hypothetical protein
MNISSVVLGTIPYPASSRAPLAEVNAEPRRVESSTPEVAGRGEFPRSPDLSELAAKMEPPERAKQLALALEGPGVPLPIKLATLKMMLEGPGLSPPASPVERDSFEALAETTAETLGPSVTALAADAEILERVDPSLGVRAAWVPEAKAPSPHAEAPGAPETARPGSIPPSASALARAGAPPPKATLDLKG